MGNKITEKLRQGGFTLMEMIAAMVVMGSVMVGVYSLSEQSLNNTKGAVVALHLRTVGDAANQYIKANTSTIMSYLNANPTKPYLIQISKLIADGYLPTGYALRNGEGQAACALVLKQGNNLNALVLTEGGNAIDDLTLGQVAATIGGAGGAVYTSAATTVKGAMGGWSFPIGNFANPNDKGQKCDGTGGAVSVGTGHPMMALWLTEGNADAATLYRDTIPGNPSLNTMNTPIIMGASVMKTEGGACGGASDPLGAIAKAPDGAVLSCVTGNTWQRSGSMFWRDPVPTFALLPATDLNGSVRMTQDTGRAFMRDSTAAPPGWRALAVDQNGNMTVQNNLTVGGGLGVTGSSTVGGNSTVGGSSTVGGTLSAAGGRVSLAKDGAGNALIIIKASNGFQVVLGTNAAGQLEIKNSAGNLMMSSDYYGNLNIGNDLEARNIRARQHLTVAGSSQIGGGLDVIGASQFLGTATATQGIRVYGTATADVLDGRLQVAAIARDGDSCMGEGRIARSTVTSGLILSCQSNVWKRAFGGAWRIEDGVPCYNPFYGNFSSGSSLGDLICIGGMWVRQGSASDGGGGV